MSCHYSCSSCSKPTYFDSCLSCQATRTLVSGVCYCQGLLKQIQLPTCFSSDDSSQQIAIKVLYFFSILINFIIIICFFIRYKLALTKKIIDTCQMIALILYLRFNFTTLTKSSLSVLDNYNFYYTNAYCNKATPPLNCTGLENLIAPSIVLLVFMVMYFLAYSMVYFRQSDIVKFKAFHHQNFNSCLYTYLNFSLPVNTLSLCRLVSYSPWALLLLLPFTMIYITLCTRFYRVINSKSQTKLLYRTKHCILFLYDQNYHINYIDHLYEKVEFTVKSNFLLFELTYKLFWCVSVIVSYEFKPALTGYVLVLLLWVQFFHLRVFCKYENTKLLIFLALDIVFVGCISTFWFSFFEQLIFWVVCLLQLALQTAFIFEMIINQFQMKIQNRIFAITEESEPAEVIEQQGTKKEAAKKKQSNTSDLELLEV